MSFREWQPQYAAHGIATFPVVVGQINKTDRNDARGIAQMMRVGLYRPVHVKTLRSQKKPSVSGLGQQRKSGLHVRLDCSVLAWHT